MSKRLKKPLSLYPVYGFRVPEDKETGESPQAVKDRITKLIKRVEGLYEGQMIKGRFAWNRNRIIVKALELGLDQLVRKKR